MISKTLLNEISRKMGLSLYQQEKDYLLQLFLFYYYKKRQEAIFKGGTCLKYLFGLERFSEDLDFNIKDADSFKDQVHQTLTELEEIGIKSYFIKEELFEDSYTCTIGFSGPLFTGEKQTQNKFRIDAGYRTGTFLKPEWKLMKGRYPETGERFLVLTMHQEEILAEKIAALFNRKKGRDLYDLWFLLQAKVPLDKKLLERKLKQENIKMNIDTICSRQEYERDMSKLVSRMIPYEQVKREVVEFLRG